MRAYAADKYSLNSPISARTVHYSVMSDRQAIGASVNLTDYWRFHKSDRQRRSFAVALRLEVNSRKLIVLFKAHVRLESPN